MNYKKLLNFISLILILIGFIGFIGGFVISMRLIEFKNEIPLGDIEGILVSKDGRIFLGLQFYGKIQSYDNQGNYIMNWDVTNSGGVFRMDIKNDTITVATARGDNLIKYDLVGNKLSQQNISNIYSKFKDSNQFTDNLTSSTYKINNGLFPNITRQKDGKCEKIITMSLLQKIFKGPMPAWLLAVFGMILRFLVNKEEMMKEINQYR
jgi:uncharacterized protein YneF (UPF0154 family)